MNLYQPYVREENTFHRLPTCGDLFQAQHSIRKERSKKGCTAQIVMQKDVKTKRYVLLDMCRNYVYGYIKEEELCQLPLQPHTRN